MKPKPQYILTLQERRQLRMIKTDKKQAETIRWRNQTLLKLLDKLISGEWTYASSSNRTDIGCPHCHLYHQGCAPCAWNLLNEKTTDPPCLYQTFGTLSLTTISDSNRTIEIVYGSTTEWIRCEEGFEDIEAQECRTFLLGHIEWSNYVLHRRWGMLT
jgi:hypothetical protein